MFFLQSDDVLCSVSSLYYSNLATAICFSLDNCAMLTVCGTSKLRFLTTTAGFAVFPLQRVGTCIICAMSCIVFTIVSFMCRALVIWNNVTSWPFSFFFLLLFCLRYLSSLLNFGENVLPKRHRKKPKLMLVIFTIASTLMLVIFTIA